MRIFNQIRKVLIKSGNLKDYFKYALGEIVLVVLGILIALQINTWNEERKSNNEKQLVLEILKQSFEKNEVEIENTLDDYSNALILNDLRIKNSGPLIENIDQSTIDSLRIIDVVKLELANNLNSNILIDNKSTSLLDGEMRNLLLEYTTHFSKYKNAENNTATLSLKLRENHQKYISLLSENAEENDIEISNSNLFESDYLSWLRDRDYQNISVEIKWKMQQAVLYLRHLQDLNEAILETLSKES